MSEHVHSIADFNAEAIEKDLLNLWSQAIASNKDTEQPVRRRAVNMVAMVADNKGADAVAKASKVLARRHPGRYIIMILNPDKDILDGWERNSVCCRLAVECSASVCYERIILPNVPGKATELPGIIKSLLHADLPVILWWRYILNPREMLFEEFSQIATRIIIDSITLKNPGKGFAKILELCERGRNNKTLSDINWARLNPWRFAVAGFYDIPAYQPFLSRVNHLEIEYGHQLSRHNLVNNSQVLLTFGWLASRLKWRIVSGIIEEQPEILYRVDMASETGPIACHFRMFPASSHKEAGIRKIKMTAESEPIGQFTISLCDDGCHMRTSITLGDKHPAEKITCLEVGNEVDLVNNQMNIASHDDIYRQTLAWLGGSEAFW